MLLEIIFIQLKNTEMHNTLIIHEKQQNLKEWN